MPAQRRRTESAPPSTPGALWEFESAGAPGGDPSEGSRHGLGDGETRRLGEQGGFPLRPGDPRFDQASSNLLPRLAAGEEDPRGRCWGCGQLPSPPHTNPAVWEGSHQRALPGVRNTGWCCRVVLISIAALCDPVVCPDPPPPPSSLPPSGPPPSPPAPPPPSATVK